MAKRSKPEIVDVEALRAALVAAEARADEAQAAAHRAEAEAAAVRAQLSGDAALIAHLRFRVVNEQTGNGAGAEGGRVRGTPGRRAMATRDDDAR